MARTPRSSRRKTHAPEAPLRPDAGLALSPPALAGLSLGLGLVYFLLSYLSDGFYQHDEVAHFISMRQFWHDPSVALGNWAKPGYKVLYALPALFGPTAVTLVNALVAAACAYVATRLAEKLGVGTPLLAFVLLAFQPLWMDLAFRNYSELPTALLLVGAVWAHYAGRNAVAALLLSYAATIRQELYVLVALYGGVLVYRRAFGAALCLLVFPLLNHVWGWAATGNPRYLLDETVGTSQNIQDAYPRQGFWHYFSTLHVVFGGLTLAALFVYLGQVGLERQRPHLFVLVPAALYFAAHVAFQIQSFRLGPSTGGNLRYLTVMAPLVAVLGAVGVDRLRQTKRVTVLTSLGVLTLVAAVFWTYEDNNIALTDARSMMPLGTVLVGAALLAVPLTTRGRTLALAGAAVVLAALTFEPYARTPEDALMEEVAAWSREHDLAAHPLLVTHPLFHYFNSRAPGDYPHGAAPVLGPTVDTARVGTRIVWDSHYSYRPALRPDDVSYEMLLRDTTRFRLVREPFITSDQRFGVFVFEKRRP